KYIALDYKLSNNHRKKMDIYPELVSKSILFNNIYMMRKKRNVIEYDEISITSDSLRNENIDEYPARQQKKPLIYSNIKTKNKEISITSNSLSNVNIDESPAHQKNKP